MVKTKRTTYPVVKNLFSGFKCPDPECDGELVLLPESIFTSVKEGYELFECKKCGKIWQLAFREVKTEVDNHD